MTRHQNLFIAGAVSETRCAADFDASIALKMLMAVTGVFFVLFVLLHMYGNLKAFADHEAYNDSSDVEVVGSARPGDRLGERA